MIVHVILCLNKREIQKKEKRKEKERKIINQEDQISELTFNFSRALSISTFSENELTIFTKKKRKEKNKDEIKKNKKKRSFSLCPPNLKKSISYNLLKTCL